MQIKSGRFSPPPSQQSPHTYSARVSRTKRRVHISRVGSLSLSLSLSLFHSRVAFDVVLPESLFSLQEGRTRGRKGRSAWKEVQIFFLAPKKRGVPHLAADEQKTTKKEKRKEQRHDDRRRFQLGRGDAAMEDERPAGANHVSNRHSATTRLSKILRKRCPPLDSSLARFIQKQTDHLQTLRTLHGLELIYLWAMRALRIMFDYT